MRATLEARTSVRIVPLVAMAAALVAVTTIAINPYMAPLALLFALVGVLGASIYVRLQTKETDTAARSSLAKVGLTIASVAVAPLIAWAILWLTLIVIIAGAWLLHALGLA